MKSKLKKETIISAVVLAALVALVAIKKLGPHSGSPWPVRNQEQVDRRTVILSDGAWTLAASSTAEAKQLAIVDQTTVEAKALVGDVVGTKPNYVVVSLGAGDLAKSVPLEDTIAALDAIFAQVQSAGALAMYVAPDIPDGVGDNWMMAIEDTARRNGVMWVKRSSNGIAADVAKALETLH